MIIKILGAESLGVRGLACSIELKNRKIFIDPGLALGWLRHKFLPHPFQVAIGAQTKKRIIEELKNASDVIISHFDGDHCPLHKPNPYQLGINEIENILLSCRIWAKNPNSSSATQQKRRRELAETIKKDLQNAEEAKEGSLEFSSPVPHGAQGKEENMIMMTKVEENGITFVHASDIQLLDSKTIEKILDWKPNIVLASGPPLYHYSNESSADLREKSWQNAIKLSKNVGTVIIDHHLLRSEEGINWLTELKRTSKNEVHSAASFMKREPLFLEAWRKELYEWLPVDENWHEDYKQGKARLDDYRLKGWDVLISNRKIKPCKWYYCCPIKEYTDAGNLERYWIENYCLINNKNCIRYQMEEKNIYHPDNMMPDGKIRNNL